MKKKRYKKYVYGNAITTAQFNKSQKVQLFSGMVLELIGIPARVIVSRVFFK